MTVEEWLNNDELALKIWHNKYQYKGESFDEWLDRVSGHNEGVKQLIIEKKFIFGGRILANRGVTDRKVTYSNCYVLPRPEDTLESIFKTASDMARTFSYGGGVGIDLSNLRPKGAETHNAAKESSGPVSFMDLFSQVTQTISQNGRRGATMISLDINHPDVEEFIDCKTDLSKVNYANISVRVNDDFMKAVESDSEYTLKWPCNSATPKYTKKVKARNLFIKLAKNNWQYAEPGILYWDKISNYNLLEGTGFEYAGVNPCRPYLCTA